MKPWILAVLLTLAGFLAGMKVQELRNPSSKAAPPHANSGSTSHATPESNAPGENHNSAKAQERDHAPKSLTKGDEVANALETLARTSPALLDRLVLRLFNGSLEPVPEDWEMLGTEKEHVQALSENLKRIFKEMREDETRQFEVVSQSDQSVQITLAKLTPEEAKRRIQQIDDSYSQVFDSELAKRMGRVFIDRNSSITAGLTNRDRIVTITRTPEDVFARTGRRYEIETRTTFEGTKLSDAIKDHRNYTQNHGSELVEDVPAHWSHLFGKPE
jgi:hypothetical protein